MSKPLQMPPAATLSTALARNAKAVEQPAFPRKSWGWPTSMPTPKFAD